MYLGLLLDSVAMEVTITEKRKQNLLKIIGDMLRDGRTTRKQLHELQGKCLAINLELIWRAHALIRSPACVPVPASVPRTLRAPAWVA